MASRESFFECTVTIGGQETTLVVRGWTALEARMHALDRLRAEGFPEPDSLSVRARGRPSLAGWVPPPIEAGGTG